MIGRNFQESKRSRMWFVWRIDTSNWSFAHLGQDFNLKQLAMLCSFHKEVRSSLEGSMLRSVFAGGSLMAAFEHVLFIPNLAGCRSCGRSVSAWQKRCAAWRFSIMPRISLQFDPTLRTLISWICRQFTHRTSMSVTELLVRMSPSTVPWRPDLKRLWRVKASFWRSVVTSFCSVWSQRFFSGVCDSLGL